MSNLLGQPFDDWVTKQIDVRQKSLGKYSTPQIQANLVKTPWIRLASSIDLTLDFEGGGKLKDGVPQKLKDAGLNVSDFKGVELAKKSILYGGVVSMTGEGNSITQNSSINNGNSPFNGAYGWGGVDERGYVPMPGITDVSVKYQNNGALSKATINIKCFSKRQFQIIDVLYLRPGYSLLLEFGHSTYLNNNEEYESFENFSSKPLLTLFNPKGKTQYDIYKEIKETRKEYDGNYEAVYGKITTFKWSFNTDGSYECQITLTGMGDVIESLKMNVSVDKEELGFLEEKLNEAGELWENFQEKAGEKWKKFKEQGNEFLEDLEDLGENLLDRTRPVSEFFEDLGGDFLEAAKPVGEFIAEKTRPVGEFLVDTAQGAGEFFAAGKKKVYAKAKKVKNDVLDFFGFGGN